MLREVFIKEVDNNILITANVLINNSDKNFWVFEDNKIKFIDTSENNYKFNRHFVVIMSEKELSNVALIPSEMVDKYRGKVGTNIFIEEGPYHFNGANKLIEFVKKNHKKLNYDKV